MVNVSGQGGGIAMHMIGVSADGALSEHHHTQPAPSMAIAALRSTATLSVVLGLTLLCVLFTERNLMHNRGASWMTARMASSTRHNPYPPMGS